MSLNLAQFSSIIAQIQLQIEAEAWIFVRSHLSVSPICMSCVKNTINSNAPSWRRNCVDLTHFPFSDERRTLSIQSQRYKISTSNIESLVLRLNRQITDSENHSNWEFHIVFSHSCELLAFSCIYFEFILIFCHLNYSGSKSLQQAIHSGIHIEIVYAMQ